MNFSELERSIGENALQPVRRMLTQVLKEHGISLSDINLNRGNEIVNVKAFGARGDGLSDDTKAIQKAIALSEGKIICFPQGRYKLSDTLHPKSNQVYLALGEVTLQRINNRIMFWLLPDKNLIAKGAYFGIKNAKFVNFTFDNNGVVVNGGENFAMAYADNIQFYNCTFLNNRGTHTVEISGCRNIYFKRCKFLGCVEKKVEGREIIQIEYTTNKNKDKTAANPTNTLDEFQNLIIQSENICLDDCYFGPSDSLPAGTRAIGNHYSNRALFSPNKLIVKNCTFTGLGLGAIRSFIMKDAVITDSKFTNTPSALSFNRGTNKVSNANIVFKNNYVETVNQNGIYPIYCEEDKDYGNVNSKIQVLNNVFTGDFLDKYIYLANCNGIVISRNKFIGNSNYLLELFRCNGAIVRENTATGNITNKGDAIRVFESSNTSIQRNKIFGR